jgi:Asp-tRNA(Asn)/Glu-tRNA(Gln) amidotransferase A subunit family amidase
MDAARRALLKSAAAGSFIAGASALAACAERAGEAAEKGASAGAAPLSTRTIAEAEKVCALAYTERERAMLREGLEDSLTILAKLRAVEFGNSEPPALLFNPRLPNRRYRAQKNAVKLAGRLDSKAPASGDAIAYASVAQQGAWLRAKAISSAELTEIYLARIAKFDPTLFAFITVAADAARRQARAADADFARGRDRGPLQGIPYALKDLADTAGTPTTWGAEPYRGRVPDADAEIVRKLNAAGAVMLGKTAVGALAYGDRWFGGVTRNPWNPSEGSSGSSAGSAAATAAGLCSFAIGTETLGSIISPSERCGTVGLRPTFGRVSRAGLMSLCWSLDKAGVLCRAAEDAAIVLSEINGFDADDPGSARMGFAYDGGADLKQMVVGYAPEWFEKGDGADRAALDAVRETGATVKEFPWPSIDVAPLEQIIMVEAAAAFAELTLTNRDDELGWQAPQAWPNTWRTARFFPAVDFVQIDRLRRRVMAELAAAFDGFDALIGPHYAGGALLATNCAGLPQLAVRTGFAQTPTRGLSDESKGGGETFRTPRGISLWANLYEEGKIIALARAIEERLGVASVRPPNF